MKENSGFTIIELILVIIILGILAAFALPKYISLDKDGRTAAMKSLLGSIRSASEMVHAVAIVRNAAPNGSIVDSGVTIVLGASRYPATSASGIKLAVSNADGYDVVFGANNTSTANFTFNGYTGANCYVLYNATNSSTAPIITANFSGC